jgi:hypothetical protein
MITIDHEPCASCETAQNELPRVISILELSYDVETGLENLARACRAKGSCAMTGSKLFVDFVPKQDIREEATNA